MNKKPGQKNPPEVKMELRFEKLAEEHRKHAIDIFNYYIENSFAAFPDKPVPYAAFNLLLQNSMTHPALAVTESGKCVAFGLLRPYSQIPSFGRTAEVTYFIHKDFTGRSIGSELLKRLENAANESGINILLAGISSLNSGSLRFHEKNGFTVCGRFKNIGMKKGEVFDVIWMQKVPGVKSIA